MKQYYQIGSKQDQHYAEFTVDIDSKIIVINYSINCDTKQDFLLLWRETCLTAFMAQVALFFEEERACVTSWTYDALLKYGCRDPKYSELGLNACRKFDNYTITKQI